MSYLNLLQIGFERLKIFSENDRLCGGYCGRFHFQIIKSSQQNAESLDALIGDPTGNRTPVSGVRGRF